MENAGERQNCGTVFVPDISLCTLTFLSAAFPGSNDSTICVRVSPSRLHLPLKLPGGEAKLGLCHAEIPRQPKQTLGAEL